MSKKESNPVYHIIKQFKLLFIIRDNNSESTEEYSRLILLKLRSIFSSKATGEAFVYFLRYGASSAWVLQCRLKMTEPTAYRAMKTLRSLGFIVPAVKVERPKRSKGGPRPVIWVMEGAKSEDVAEALRVHNKMLSPKFRVAEQVAKGILDEFREKDMVLEINYREIVTELKKRGIPFRGPDIADMTARYLHEQGMKVWR